MGADESMEANEEEEEGNESPRPRSSRKSQGAGRSAVRPPAKQPARHGVAKERVARVGSKKNAGTTVTPARSLTVTPARSLTVTPARATPRPPRIPRHTTQMVFWSMNTFFSF